MPDELVIRVAGGSDIAAVAKLRLAWGDGAPADEHPDFERHLLGRMDSRWGYLGNMFVRADCRNRGVGSALLSAVVAAAEERRYVRIVLAPTVRSVPFYRRAGFVDAGGAEDDRLLMRPSRLS